LPENDEEGKLENERKGSYMFYCVR
jgi:hypothetical protein